MKSCVYATYASGHPTRFCDYWLKTLKGEVKLLGLARGVLLALALAIKEDRQKNKKMRTVHHLLGDIKVPLNLMRTPQSVLSLRTKCARASKSYQTLSIHFSREEKSPNTKYLLFKAWIHSCAVAQSSLSLSGKFFFKPLLLMDRYCELEGRLHQIGESWKYFSIAKNGFKIGRLTGQLVIGTNKVPKKSLSLFFASSSMTCHILKLCNVNIKPVAIPLKLGKCAFEIYKACIATA